MYFRPVLLLALLAACPTDDDDSAAPEEVALWAAGAPSPASSTGEDVVAMPDGGAVAVGAFAGTITFGSGGSNETVLTSAGDFDLFVARYGADGALAWAVRAGGAGTDWAWAVEVDGAGGLWVVGQFGQTATFGPGEAGETLVTSVAGQDLYVARFAADGTLDHVHTAGGDNQQVATGVAVAADGGVFVSGYVWANVTFGPGEANEVTLLSLGAQDAFLARFDSTGELAWVRTVTGGSSVIAYDVAATADGGAISTGEFVANAIAGQGDPAETSLVSVAGNVDSWVARWDGAGVLQWARNDSTSFPDGGRAVAADGDDALAAGSFRGGGTFGAGQPGETDVQSGGFDDAYLVRYDSAGQIGLVRTAGGSATQGSTLPRAVAAAPDGAAVLVGQYSATTSFGSFSFTEAGAGDGFVALYDDAGDLRYALPLGGPGSDSVQGVDVTDDAVFLTGWYGADAVFDLAETAIEEFTGIHVDLAAVGDAEFFLVRYPR